MREGTVCADLYLSAPAFNVVVIARTLLQAIHGTVTEKAIEFIQPFVARKIFTISVFEKTI